MTHGKDILLLESKRVNQVLLLKFNMNNKYIVYFDDEYSFFYMCHGFENIPEIIKQNKKHVNWLIIGTKEKGLSYDNLFVEYKQICDKHNINPKLKLTIKR